LIVSCFAGEQAATRAAKAMAAERKAFMETPG
jgi:hypothetical protein